MKCLSVPPDCTLRGLIETFQKLRVHRYAPLGLGLGLGLCIGPRRWQSEVWDSLFP